MKIEPTSSPEIGLSAITERNSAQNKSGSATDSAGSEKVLAGSVRVSRSNVIQMALEAEDASRAERVHQLKNSVQNGSYTVDTPTLSMKLIMSLLVG